MVREVKHKIDLNFLFV